MTKLASSRDNETIVIGNYTMLTMSSGKEFGGQLDFQ